MNKRRVNKRLKRNKYRIYVTIAAILLAIFAITSIRARSKEASIAKYDNEILIVKGGGDQLDSLTLKEIRGLGPSKKIITLNNGLEKIPIEGVPIEKIIGNIDFNLRDKTAVVIEDNEGNSKRLNMSTALEPDRVYLVYKINESPVYELSPVYGKMIIIDTNQESSKSWFTNVKTIDIQ